MLRIVLVGLLSLCCCARASGQTLKVLLWNVQNDDSFSGVIRDQLRELQAEHQFDLVGLSEVDEDNVTKYQQALTAATTSGGTFAAEVSDTGGGGGDFLVILYNAQRFTVLDTVEFVEFGGHEVNFEDSQGRLRFRSPFAARLRDEPTQVEFLFMVNHLVRRESNSPLRDSQVRGLNAWAAAQTLPVVMGGDMNFDWNIPLQDGNSSADLMLADDSPWRWIRPTELIDTNWSDDPRQVGQQDRFPDTILDFVFAASQAASWPATSMVIVRDDDFPDDERTSDHRPVLATLVMSSPEPTPARPPAAPTPGLARRAGGGAARPSPAGAVLAAVGEVDSQISRRSTRLAQASRFEVSELQQLVKAKQHLLSALLALQPTRKGSTADAPPPPGRLPRAAPRREERAARRVFQTPGGRTITITDSGLFDPGEFMLDGSAHRFERGRIAPLARSAGDNFQGKKRKAAKTSIACGPVQEFDGVQALIDELPTDDFMRDHDPEISSAEDSQRVAEEDRNVRVSCFLLAASREDDNDFHMIISDSPVADPDVETLNVELSGLPASGPHRGALKDVRDFFKAALDGDLPGHSYDFYDPPIAVAIEGSLFYDIDHSPGHVGPGDLKPSTCWEIHPITRIEFED